MAYQILYSREGVRAWYIVCGRYLHQLQIRHVLCDYGPDSLQSSLDPDVPRGTSVHCRDDKQRRRMCGRMCHGIVGDRRRM